jgi:16S rRNA (uracil1498-N3)-methyltransferase
VAHRLYVAPEQLASGTDEVLLQPEQTHYLRDVLRLRPGAELELFDGRGARLRCVLSAPGAVRVVERMQGIAAAVHVIVAQALAKGEKMDLVVQKCTELGAARIVPLLAARSVVKVDADRGAGKAARWQKIAQEAARQSERADVPMVDAPATWAALFELSRGRCAVLLEPRAPARLSEVVRGATEVVLAIGPEGGFTEGEIAAALSAGFTAVGLGPLVLRTETAALAALSVLQHLHGALG